MATVKLIFLTGFMGVKADWDRVINQLTSHSSIEPQVLTAPYELAEREAFWLCGYSMGGRVAIALAASPLCRGVISVSGSPGIRDDAERGKRAEADERIAQRLENLRTETEFRDFLLEWWSQPVFGGSTLDETARRELLESRLSMNPRELAGHLRKFGPAVMPSLWGQWSQLSIPRLAIAGERDPKYAVLAREMGQHQILPNAGHQIPLEQPEALARVIKEFCSRDR